MSPRPAADARLLGLLAGDGARLQSPAGPVELVPYPVADLALPTGRILACDPFGLLSAEALALEVPPDDYAVVLTAARLPDGTLQVAAATLRLGRGKVARWEPARLEGQEAGEGGDGYTCESGAACYVDAGIQRAFGMREDAEDEDEDDYEHDAARARAAWRRVQDDDEEEAEAQDAWDDFSEALERALARVRTGLRWVARSWERDGEGNLLAWAAGRGPGRYPVWVGLDARGTPISLVTDFGVVDPAWSAVEA